MIDFCLFERFTTDGYFKKLATFLSKVAHSFIYDHLYIIECIALLIQIYLEIVNCNLICNQNKCNNKKRRKTKK